MGDLPPYDAPLAVLILAALATLASRQFSGAQLLAASPVLLLALEGGALLLQQHWMLRSPTAAVDLSICAFALIAVLDDLRVRRRLLAEAARQRDQTRAMLSQAIADNFDGIVVLDETRQSFSPADLRKRSSIQPAQRRTRRRRCPPPCAPRWKPRSTRRRLSNHARREPAKPSFPYLAAAAAPSNMSLRHPRSRARRAGASPA